MGPFSVIVFYFVTGLHVLTFNIPGGAIDNKAFCEYWLASNATRLHGALYANGFNAWSDKLEDGGLRSDEKRCTPGIPTAAQIAKAEAEIEYLRDNRTD